MAKFDIRMPEDFLLKVSSLADKTDEIVSKVLEAGADVMISKVKSNMESLVGKNTKYKSKSTGELVSALGKSPVKQDKNGTLNIKIGFAEPRSDGGSNAMLANLIEYGKHGQPPQPFLKPAKSAAGKACIETMKSTLTREMGNI